MRRVIKACNLKLVQNFKCVGLEWEIIEKTERDKEVTIEEESGREKESKK